METESQVCQGPWCLVDTEVAAFERVSGFGYLSEPDKRNDKQPLRDKVNVMLIDYPEAEQRIDGLNKSLVRYLQKNI